MKHSKKTTPPRGHKRTVEEAAAAARDHAKRKKSTWGPWHQRISNAFRAGARWQARRSRSAAKGRRVAVWGVWITAYADYGRDLFGGLWMFGSKDEAQRRCDQMEPMGHVGRIGTITLPVAGKGRKR